MTIFSFRDFYLGIDKRSFFDVQIHCGRYRLEWGRTTPQDRATNKDTMYRCSLGKDL